MSRSSRRDSSVVDTVWLNQDTDMYVAVNRDGSIASNSVDAFGITMSSEDKGSHVRVCRRGFCPVQVVTAANNNSEGTELIVINASGKVDTPPSEGDVSTAIVAVDTTNNVVSVSGDHTSVLSSEDSFDIIGSTGNDGTYTVSSISYDGTNTNITTNESISDSTADGSIITHKTAYIVAVSEEATAADGSQTGAYVDCLKLGRNRQIPASI